LVRDEDVWYLDSSATRHATPIPIAYNPISSAKTVFVEDDHKCEIKGMGTIPIILNNGKYKHMGASIVKWSCGQLLIPTKV
jgi:hypothetical protein